MTPPRPAARESFICGPSKEYFYGDPRPDKSLGYLEFVEWQHAQLTRRRARKRAARQSERGGQ